MQPRLPIWKEGGWNTYKLPSISHCLKGAFRALASCILSCACMWAKLSPRCRKRSWNCSRDLASTELGNCHYEVSWDHSELLTPNIAEIRGWQRRCGLGMRGICYVYFKKYQDLHSRNMPVNLPFSIYFLVFIIHLTPNPIRS